MPNMCWINDSLEESRPLVIFNNPIVLAQIFDSKSLNVDLLNDDIALSNKADYLNKFKYKIFS